MKLVLASGNRGKAAELGALLAPLGWELVSQAELGVVEVEETGATFLDNALLKARHAAAATGLPALADDSGLEVDALDGAPGVHSARYSGEHATDEENVAHLLAALAGLGVEEPAARRARFRCVLVLRWPDGTELTTSGAVEGHLAAAPVGDAGFGYDPIFVPDEGDGRTFAQMTAGEKQAISHRGRALAELVRLLER
jgi:XTP/dITP diphosphohydrolase